MIVVASLLMSANTAGSAAAARSKTAREPNPGPETTSFAALGCPTSSGGLRQTLNGRVSGCIRVGALGAGPYRVELQQVIVQTSLGAAVHETTTVPPGEVGGAGPAATLTLSPPSGTPGARVTVTGRVKTPISRREVRARYVDLCWDGCRNGLRYEGQPVRWTSPTTFRTTLEIPATPWIETDPTRVLRPASGQFSIAVQCLVQSVGCAEYSEGSAAFTLSVAKSPTPSWCATARSCALLTVVPRVALPGDVVRVTGEAPLVTVVGGQPFTGLGFEVTRGGPGGPEVRFGRSGYATEADFGHGTFTVTAAPTWSSLPAATPINELQAGLPPISADPSDPSVMAWCDDGGVALSGLGPQTQIPTASAAPVLTALGFGPFTQVPPTCATTIPEGAGTGRPTVVTVFYVSKGMEGEGPFTADVALFTTDSGQTWTAVPVPAGESPTDFGGLRVNGEEVEALFMPEAKGLKRLTQPEAEAEDSSDGSHWQSANLQCPAEGPCVTLGSYSTVNCDMVPTSQALLRSTDGGVSWTQVEWPNEAGACASSELVATSPTTELLIDSASVYSVTRSTDGGASWADIALPTLPDQKTGTAVSALVGGLTVLPDGSLLSITQGADAESWELLTPAQRVGVPFGACPKQWSSRPSQRPWFSSAPRSGGCPPVSPPLRRSTWRSPNSPADSR